MPLNFLWGDEDYLLERALEKIKKETLGEDINPLNFRLLDNPDFAEFSQCLRTAPFMFGNIVIAIKCQKYFLETKSKIKLDDAQTTELISGFKNIADSVNIVLICPTPWGEKKKPDSRKKLYKEILKLTKPLEFQSYRSFEEYKIIPELNKIAASLGLKIGQKEASYLIQTTGTKFRELAGTLEKIKLALHPKTQVTLDIIKEFATSAGDIYGLVDKILAHDFSSAFGYISEILQKDHFLPSLMFMQTTFSNLVKTKIYSKTMSPYDIALKLGMSEFVVKKNLERIQNTPLDELVRFKINLEDAEYKLKSGILRDPVCAYEIAFMGER